MSRYCHIHGSYPDWKDGCPDCREAEERAEERARDAEERAEQRAYDAEYRRANPGDYRCPSCLFQTLRKDASACPRCQREVTPEYWAGVRRVEEAAAKAAAKAAEEAEAIRRAKAAKEAEEWKRGEPARLAAAAAEKAKATAKRRLSAKLSYLHLIWTVPASGIGGGIAGFIHGGGADIGLILGVLAAFVGSVIYARGILTESGIA